MSCTSMTVIRLDTDFFLQTLRVEGVRVEITNESPEGALSDLSVVIREIKKTLNGDDAAS